MITTEVMSSPSLDDAGSNRCQSRSRHASQEDCLFPASNQDADELFAESDSALALAIHASMEDFEVQVGPISGYYGDDQTLFPGIHITSTLCRYIHSTLTMQHHQGDLKKKSTM
ncbi:putative nicotinate-nucleotide adenylyltransferase [Dissostichus eleginoides]|uniref:Nicotinate-nucleotide adenylyltransferase n=1 Tax=Dissostichus eleginoides TaxID=100907 RepID=A0AAD9EWA4_DISEL|nr:putative nicotinate-nucleotide adenylyltransferase [Dissostichus eleginoides]